MDFDSKPFLQYICLVTIIVLISIFPLIICLFINYFITNKRLKRNAEMEYLAFKRV